MIERSGLLVLVALTLWLSACESRPRTYAFDGRCWIRGADGKLAIIDAHVENIETCGARLEVRHLQTGAPVAGAFGGTAVFANSKAIEAATPWGHRIRLVSQADRMILDDAIRRLLDQPSGMAAQGLSH